MFICLLKMTYEIGGGVVANKNWQAREKKLNRRRDIKDQKKFYREPKPDKNKIHKLVIREKNKQQ